MKLRLQFIIAAFIALVVYIPVAHGQANLTFSGGSGAPLVITLQQTVTYTIINDSCASITAFFVFDEVGNLFDRQPGNGTGNITYSINNGTSSLITNESSGFTTNDISVNDLYAFGNNRSGVTVGSTVVLSAGTITTTNVAAAPPANGSFATFITNGNGVRCSNIVTRTTAASVSISGRVATSSGRGISRVRLSLTDSQGNVRTATSDDSGNYRFDDVQVGETYVLSASGKGYSFSQPVQVLNVNEETNEINFIADYEKRLRAF